MAEPGTGEDAGYSAGSHTGVGGADIPASRHSNKIGISRRTKVRLIKVLDAVIILGIIVSVILGLIILNRVQAGINANHKDSDTNNRIIICMLQVPIAERTPDLETKCRKGIEEQQKNGGSSSLQPTPQPVLNTSSKPTVAGQMSPPAPTNVSTPSSTSPSSAPTSGGESNSPAPAASPSLGQSIINVIRAVPQTIKDIL